jgi:hypothetical protein
MKLYSLLAIVGSIALIQPAFAGPVDPPAAQKLRQIRAEEDAKKKALLEERAVVASEPASPVEPLELPMDETDSPGATKQ